jgi:hypothetical protein
MKDIFDCASPSDEGLEHWLAMSEFSKREYLESHYVDFQKYLANSV